MSESEYMHYSWPSRLFPQNNHKDIRFTNCTDRNEAVKILKQKIKNIDDHELKLNLPHDEGELEKFLYARKFDLEETLDLLKNYYYHRKRYREIYENLLISNDQDMRKSLENTLPGVLRQKDRKGRTVLIFIGSNWDCSYPLLTIYRSLIFTLEHLINNNVHNQCNGFVIIVDWTGFTLKQTSNLKPSILKLFIEGLQDCFPARFKGVHFVNQPWYVLTALTFIKPFLNEKIKERIFVHGNNLSTLHEHVHKDVLPAELGGEEPSYDPRQFLDEIKEC